MNLTTAKTLLGMNPDDTSVQYSREQLFGRYYWVRFHELFNIARMAQTNGQFDIACNQIDELCDALVQVYRAELSHRAADASDVDWMFGGRNAIRYLRAQRTRHLQQDLERMRTEAYLFVPTIESYLELRNCTTSDETSAIMPMDSDAMDHEQACRLLSLNPDEMRNLTRLYVIKKKCSVRLDELELRVRRAPTWQDLQNAINEFNQAHEAFCFLLVTLMGSTTMKRAVDNLKAVHASKIDIIQKAHVDVVFNMIVAAS